MSAYEFIDHTYDVVVVGAGFTTMVRLAALLAYVVSPLYVAAIVCDPTARFSVRT